MKQVEIVACGSYLPERSLTNDELAAEKNLDTSDEWIFQRTGIKCRHIADDAQLTSDLATIAMQRAMERGNIAASFINGIIVATTTPDIIFPSTAVKVQNNLGIKSAFAFDIQAVCSGFVYGLCVAYSMIKCGVVDNIAVIGAETMSKILNWEDRSTCVLFGDGAGAFILRGNTKESSNNGSDIIDCKLSSDINLIDILKVDGGISKGKMDAKLSMNGQAVFMYAVTQITKLIRDILEKNGYSVDDVNHFILHQANARIANLIQQKLAIDKEKMPTSIDKHANTSAASIPLLFDDCYGKNRFKKGDLILFAAVGAGMTSGVVLIRY